MKITRLLILSKLTKVATVGSLAFLILVALSIQVSALSGSSFNAGRIIDDAVFYNSNAMETSQIQAFLNSKVPNCDYNGSQSAADWGYPNITHAQLAEYKRNGTNGFRQDSSFHAPPYRCLTMYSQTTPQMEAASGYCGAINAGTRSAAQIINDVAKACDINPQVLIVLLEKEQSLVTDNWPLNRQLRSATGFACPDTAPCNPAYEGFFYQVYNAARQFKVYRAYPNSYNYVAGRTNRVYWQTNLGNYINPSGNVGDPARVNAGYSSCGHSNVYIENQATAALYIYTPYRPNQAALNNLRGTGDACSAYGNRNFWRLFSDWFGSTHGFIYGGIDYSTVFDPTYYAYNNPDVQAAFGDDQIGMFYHFLFNGVYEGRQASGSFSINSYRTRYEDLRNAYGTDMQKYLAHYIHTGKREGRVATGDYRGGTTVYNGVDYSSIYSFDYYTRTYPDIWSTFGLDDKKALHHFLFTGLFEKRQGNNTFNVHSYKVRYPDLRAAYGDNLYDYIWHYIHTGKREGRVAT